MASYNNIAHGLLSDQDSQCSHVSSYSRYSNMCTTTELKYVVS